MSESTGGYQGAGGENVPPPGFFAWFAKTPDDAPRPGADAPLGEEYRDPVGRRERVRGGQTDGGTGPVPGAADSFAWTGAKAPQPGARVQNAYAAEWLAVRLRRFRVLNPHAPVPAEFQSITTRPPAPSRLGGYLEARVMALLGAIRRLVRPEDQEPATTAAKPAAPTGQLSLRTPTYPFGKLSGLAFSGGGIRSATFCLGVLQALGERKLLHMFDFLSTVSGGGYVGGWWSAWLSRRSPSAPAGPPRPTDVPQTLFPDDERLELDRHQPLVIDPAIPLPSPVAVSPSVSAPDGSSSVALQDPIHHLRLFSNYLTPRKGLLSADTWHAITTVARNLVLTWLVLLPLLLALVTLAQLDFTADPIHASEFASSAAPLIHAPPPVPTKPSVRDSAAGLIGSAAPAMSHRSDTSPALQAARDSVVRDSMAAVRTARLNRAMTPAVVLLMWFAAAVVLWLLYSAGTLAPTVFGLVALAVMIMLLLPTSGASGWVETAIRAVRGSTSTAPARALAGERHPLSLTLLVGLWGMAVTAVVFGALIPFTTYL